MNYYINYMPVHIFRQSLATYDYHLASNTPGN